MKLSANAFFAYISQSITAMETNDIITPRMWFQACDV
jgi:hypothetical protein